MVTISGGPVGGASCAPHFSWGFHSTHLPPLPSGLLRSCGGCGCWRRGCGGAGCPRAPGLQGSWPREALHWSSSVHLLRSPASAGASHGCLPSAHPSVGGLLFPGLNPFRQTPLGRLPRAQHAHFSIQQIWSTYCMPNCDSGGGPKKELLLSLGDESSAPITALQEERQGLRQGLPKFAERRGSTDGGGNCWGWEGAGCQGAGKEGGPPSLKGDRNRQGHGSLSRMGSCPAHQTIKGSKSRVPGTCPRAQSSKVAPGSQSPPACLQQGRREG